MAFLAGLFGGGGAAGGAAATGAAEAAVPYAAAAAPAVSPAVSAGLASEAVPMASAGAAGAGPVLSGAGMSATPAAVTASPSWLSSLGRGVQDFASGYTGIGSQSDFGLAGKFGQGMQQLQQQGASGQTDTQPPLIMPPSPSYPDPLTILQAFGIQA